MHRIPAALAKGWETSASLLGCLSTLLVSRESESFRSLIPPPVAADLNSSSVPWRLGGRFSFNGIDVSWRRPGAGLCGVLHHSAWKIERSWCRCSSSVTGLQEDGKLQEAGVASCNFQFLQGLFILPLSSELVRDSFVFQNKRIR